jgi:hypothetical protein
MAILGGAQLSLGSCRLVTVRYDPNHQHIAGYNSDCTCCISFERQRQLSMVVVSIGCEILQYDTSTKWIEYSWKSIVWLIS